MRVPDDHPLAVALAMRQPDTAVAAVAAYRRLVEAGKAVIDPLVELVESDSNVKACLAAFKALAEVDDHFVPRAVRSAFVSRFAPVRLAAIQWEQRHGPESLDPGVERLLRTDPVWGNRRAALLAVADQADDDRWQTLIAADDPHWRVRHALIRVLLEWDREEVRRRLEPLTNQRAAALLAFLEFRWTGSEPADWSAFAPPDRTVVCPFWDWDPAVLAVKLHALTAGERAARIDAMPFLAGHSDDRVWKPAVKAIREFGEPRHYRAVMDLRADPRRGVEPAIERLRDGLEEELRAELPTWEGEAPTEPVVPILPPKAVARIIANPTTAQSWREIEAACRVAKVPLWEVEPANRWRPCLSPPPMAERGLDWNPSPLGERGRGEGDSSEVNPIPPHPQPLSPRGEGSQQRHSPSPLPPLPPGEGGDESDSLPPGEVGTRVSRLGISGHYLLPPEGFARAADAGVNWFFWEPNYATLTDFSRRLSDADRRRFHFVAGTFEADGKRIRADVERALRMLKTEQLGLFLVFWVQSWDRMTDDLRDTVAKLKAEGKVESVGVSSHNRPLLVHAMKEGWNPVMARHSAGHRGAETGVFPFVPPGTSLITFNNLCYGRLLRPVAGLAPPTAADCYRYTLSFPQVSACWSAPATLEQLEENLAVLRDPTLSDEARGHLERFGAALYREEKVFEKLVRML